MNISRGKNCEVLFVKLTKSVLICQTKLKAICYRCLFKSYLSLHFLDSINSQIFLKNNFWYQFQGETPKLSKISELRISFSTVKDLSKKKSLAPSAGNPSAAPRWFTSTFILCSSSQKSFFNVNGIMEKYLNAYPSSLPSSLTNQSTSWQAPVLNR